LYAGGPPGDVAACWPQDTALISHDTSVDVDTTMRQGDRATRTDTVKNTTGQRQPGADTSTTAR
jgi:hypothetical protein